MLPKDLFALVLKEDVNAPTPAFSVIRLHYFVSGGFALFMREAENETLILHLKYHFSACERNNLSGVTSHEIDVVWKMICCVVCLLSGKTFDISCTALLRKPLYYSERSG